MSTLSIEKPQNPMKAAPKKGGAKSITPSRRKVSSTAATAKKPPQTVVSKSERVAAAKILPKTDEANFERATKQERLLTLLSRPEGDEHCRDDAGDQAGSSTACVGSWRVR